MGGSLQSCFSTKNRLYYLNIYSTEPNLLEYKEIFEALCLHQADIGRLRKIFNTIDKDHSGSIELLELLMYMDIERTPFTKRVFSIFDEDGSNTIDFKEFVMSLWNYCTLGKATLLLFAFDIYDRDSSGEISVLEIQAMLRDVYGDAYERNAHAKKIISKLDDILPGGCEGVDVDTFRAFAIKHQALLYPAFEIQREIQVKILGEEFWHFLATRRIELSHGVYVPISEFMQVHVNREVYDKFVKGNTGRRGKKGKLKASAKTAIGITGTKATRANRQSLKVQTQQQEQINQDMVSIKSSGSGSGVSKSGSRSKDSDDADEEKDNTTPMSQGSAFSRKAKSSSSRRHSTMSSNKVAPTKITPSSDLNTNADLYSFDELDEQIASSSSNGPPTATYRAPDSMSKRRNSVM